jgi:hypothetical protein
LTPCRRFIARRRLDPRIAAFVRHPEGETIDLPAVAGANQLVFAVRRYRGAEGLRRVRGRGWTPMDSRRFPETKHIAVKSDLLGLLPAVCIITTRGTTGAPESGSAVTPSDSETIGC